MPRRNPSDHKPYEPVDAAFLRALPTVMGTQMAGEVPQPRPALHPPPVATPAGTTPAEPGSGVPRYPGTPVPASPDEALEIEPLDQPVKFRVSRTEASELRRLAADLGSLLRTPVDVANVGRAFLLLLGQAEHEIRQQARRAGPLKRPKNDNMAALAEFDHRIAQILFDALRKAAPFR